MHICYSNCRVFRKWHKKLTCLPSWNPKFGGADLAAWSLFKSDTPEASWQLTFSATDRWCSCLMPPDSKTSLRSIWSIHLWKVETMKQTKWLKLTFIIYLCFTQSWPMFGHQCNVSQKISHPCGAFYLNNVVNRQITPIWKANIVFQANCSKFAHNEIQTPSMRAI